MKKRGISRRLHNSIGHSFKKILYCLLKESGISGLSPLVQPSFDVKMSHVKVDRVERRA